MVQPLSVISVWTCEVGQNSPRVLSDKNTEQLPRQYIPEFCTTTWYGGRGGRDGWEDVEDREELEDVEEREDELAAAARDDEDAKQKKQQHPITTNTVHTSQTRKIKEKLFVYVVAI